MTDERIAEIAARLAAATPGEWEAHFMADDDADDRLAILIRSTDADVATVVTDDLNSNPVSDTDFIAHAPSDIAFLLDENATLREALAECRHALVTASANGGKLRFPRTVEKADAALATPTATEVSE